MKSGKSVNTRKYRVTVPCPDCGRSFRKSVMTLMGRLWICPDCKHTEFPTNNR